MREDYCIRNPQACRASPSTTRPAPTQRTPASPTYQQGGTGNVVNPVPIIPTPPSLPSQPYVPPSAGAASSVLNSRSGMNLDFPTDEQPKPQGKPIQPKVPASPRPAVPTPNYTIIGMQVDEAVDTAWNSGGAALDNLSAAASDRIERLRSLREDAGDTWKKVKVEARVSISTHLKDVGNYFLSCDEMNNQTKQKDCRQFIDDLSERIVTFKSTQNDKIDQLKRVLSKDGINDFFKNLLNGDVGTSPTKSGNSRD